jgi:segregation and condensation protein B
MGEVDVLPELKQIVGAMLFVAKQTLSVGDIRRVLAQVAETYGGATRGFAKASEQDVRTAIEALTKDLEEKKVGLHLSEVANGFRLENDVSCGPWLRHLLERGSPQKLSRPALETLAIIAYRQPCVRSEIEAVRGVAVDQIIRNLMEMQLVRIVGRSELPGRPWQLGTTQTFLEHFGLNSLDDLPGVEELRRMEAEQLRKTQETGKEAGESEVQEEIEKVFEDEPSPGQERASEGDEEDDEEGDKEDDEEEEDEDEEEDAEDR